LIDSEAQEFLNLERQTASEAAQLGGVDNFSSNSMRYSELRASFPSQSGATKVSTKLLKPTKTPTKSLLGRYNENLGKHSTRTEFEK